MKTLLISHSCMSRTMGQPRLHCLAAYSDIELTALVPDRMCAYGAQRIVEPPDNAAFRFVVGRSRWQNVLKQWYLLHYASGLKEALEQSRPDVVDIWEEPWSMVCAQSVWWTRRLCPQAKIVIETEQNIYKRLPPPFRQFQNYSLRHADFVVARNQEAVSSVRRKGYPGPARVVPNAVDCTLFHPMRPEERGVARAALGVCAAGEFVVGYVGRLVGEKGLRDAVDALTYLPEDVRLVLVGEGPFRSDLEAQVQTLGLTRRVLFTGGKPFTDLPGVMNAFDALILPSRTTQRWKEQFGRVLIEAGACQVAVVGSDSGAIPEVVGEGGLIFPEGDAKALAESLRCLRDDPVRRTRFAAAGYERAVHLYSWQSIAAQMRNIYREILSLPADLEPDAAREATQIA